MANTRRVLFGGVAVAALMVGVGVPLAYAQQRPTPPPPTVYAEIIMPAKVDFGKVKSGTEPEKEIVITNTGRDALVLWHVTSSCGCVRPKWTPNEVVRPGKSTTVTVKLDAREGAEGPFHKTLTITSNARQSTFVTSLVGEIVR